MSYYCKWCGQEVLSSNHFCQDNRERDKFLTKLMGECYHERSAYGFCQHCGVRNFITNHFSTWEGFGKLLGFMKE